MAFKALLSYAIISSIIIVLLSIQNLNLKDKISSYEDLGESAYQIETSFAPHLGELSAPITIAIERAIARLLAKNK